MNPGAFRLGGQGHEYNHSGRRNHCWNKMRNLVVKGMGSETYYVVVGGCSEQSAECDDWCQTGEVHEEKGGNALDVETVFEVAQVPLRLQLYVLNQTSEQPSNNNRTTREHTAERIVAAYLRHATVKLAQRRYRQTAGKLVWVFPHCAVTGFSNLNFTFQSVNH